MEGRTVNAAPDSKGNPKKVGAKKAKTKKQRLQERLKAVGVKGVEKMTQAQLQAELVRIKNNGGKVPDLRHENGGQPPVASKDPLVTAMRKMHLMEEVDVVITDRSTGTIKSEKKIAMLAMLDMLRQEALKNKNVQAAKEYFDRTLGKSRQEIELETIDPNEQRLPTKADLAAAEAYLAASDEDEEDDD